jgi:hypothetical protein
MGQTYSYSLEDNSLRISIFSWMRLLFFLRLALLGLALFARIILVCFLFELILESPSAERLKKLSNIYFSENSVKNKPRHGNNYN